VIELFVLQAAVIESVNELIAELDARLMKHFLVCSQFAC